MGGWAGAQEMSKRKLSEQDLARVAFGLDPKEKEEVEAGAAFGASKRRRKAPRETPLRRFRTQQLARKKELQILSRRCHRELKQITKDLGVLKRKK